MEGGDNLGTLSGSSVSGVLDGIVREGADVEGGGRDVEGSIGFS